MRLVDAEKSPKFLDTFFFFFLQGRQWQRALVLLREMEVVDHLPPNLVCMNSAIDACAKVSTTHRTLLLLTTACAGFFFYHVRQHFVFVQLSLGVVGGGGGGGVSLLSSAMRSTAALLPSSFFT